MTSDERQQQSFGHTVFGALAGLEWASPFSIGYVACPEYADHLVLSMCGHPSKPCLEAKGSRQDRPILSVLHYTWHTFPEEKANF